MENSLAIWEKVDTQRFPPTNSLLCSNGVPTNVHDSSIICLYNSEGMTILKKTVNLTVKYKLQ